MRHLHLIGYDISENRPRNRTLRAIRGNAIGGQKSLYECWLDGSELSQIHDEIEGLINPDTDRVLIIQLDPRAAVHTLGIGTPPTDGELFYQG